MGSLKSFLTKWELIRLVTLDLPEPQGTMNAIPVHLLARLRGGAALVSYTPAFHETPSSADLRGDLIELQQLNGELNQNPMELPAAQTSPRASRESEFATLFRMWLMEITVRCRYALKHGMTGALVEGMSDALGKAASQLRMLRRKYAPNLQHHL